MDPREETSTPVLRLFGREPTFEDLRCVGRWSYAAAWLAEDTASARELVEARMRRAAVAATTAAMTGGRGDAERFGLVSALARLDEAIESGIGPLGAAAERAVDEASAQLAHDGAALRAATQRERAAFAPRFGLEGFRAAMLDVGQERHVLLREASAALNEALIEPKGPCPALQALRLFLRATLAVDAQDAATALEAPPSTREYDPIATLTALLTADLALTARRASAYEAAWAAAARMSGDALSRTLAGLTGAILSKGVAEALAGDPWALPLALAMTSEPEHASALLDFGVHAQAHQRFAAKHEVARWAAQAARVDEMEESLGIAVLASREVREGHRDLSSVGGLDLFCAWDAARTAEESRSALREAADRSLALETVLRREAVRRAKGALEAAREAYETALETARSKASEPVEMPEGLAEAEMGAQRGCVFGFGAGCSVMATYMAVGVIVGTGGLIGQIAPLVVGVTALPVAAAILAQIAVGIRRATALGEAARRRSAAMEEFERARAAAERSHRSALAQGRETLEAAEASLSLLDKGPSAAGKMAA